MTRIQRLLHRAFDLWLWVVIILLHWWAYGWHSEAEAGVLAILLSIIMSQILKYTIRRPRPLQPKLDLGMYKHDRWSFPSGHTVNAFAVATALGANHRWEWGVLVVMACGAGISRLSLRLHYPLDVVNGGIIGAVVGYVAWAVTR